MPGPRVTPMFLKGSPCHTHPGQVRRLGGDGNAAPVDAKSAPTRVLENPARFPHSHDRILSRSSHEERQQVLEIEVGDPDRQHLIDTAAGIEERTHEGVNAVLVERAWLDGQEGTDTGVVERGDETLSTRRVLSVTRPRPWLCSWSHPPNTFSARIHVWQVRGAMPRSRSATTNCPRVPLVNWVGAVSGT